MHPSVLLSATLLLTLLQSPFAHATDCLALALKTLQDNPEAIAQAAKEHFEHEGVKIEKVECLSSIPQCLIYFAADKGSAIGRRALAAKRDGSDLVLDTRLLGSSAAAYFDSTNKRFALAWQDIEKGLLSPTHTHESVHEWVKRGVQKDVAGVPLKNGESRPVEISFFKLPASFTDLHGIYKNQFINHETLARYKQVRHLLAIAKKKIKDTSEFRQALSAASFKENQGRRYLQAEEALYRQLIDNAYSVVQDQRVIIWNPEIAHMVVNVSQAKRILGHSFQPGTSDSRELLLYLLEQNRVLREKYDETFREISALERSQ